MFEVGDIIQNNMTGDKHIIVKIDYDTTFYTVMGGNINDDMPELFTVVGQVSEDTVNEILDNTVPPSTPAE